MINYYGRKGVTALLAALYPCPNSPVGCHWQHTPDSPCVWCKEPVGRREPSEAAAQRSQARAGTHSAQVVGAPPSLASRRSAPEGGSG